MAESENFYQSIFTSMIDGVLIISADLRIIEGNQATEEMFQRSKDSFEGELLSELFPNQPGLMEKARQSIAIGTAYHHVEGIGHRKPNNVYFPANLTFSPIIKDNGKSSTGALLIKDTSLIKELRETSQQIEYLSTLSVLTTGMAHEIRNPLSGIRGSAQLVLKDIENSEQREYMEIIIAEVDRINRLVKKMMSISRPASNDFKPINIHQILEEILTLERETLLRKKGTFIQAYDPSLPAIQGNEDELKQVFLNLVKNAVEASPEGGQVKITTQFSSNYVLRKPQGSPPTHSIIVEITDSGPGMNDEIIKNIFTPFFTTKKRGTGLGMVVSLKIIENHNGKIKVNSKTGVGTTVQVFLPIK